jgi:acetyl esterase/lipase
MLRRFAAALLLSLALPSLAAAQARVERNVVYGMYSGLALLMDVYRPEQSNGLGVVAIQGSGWYRALRGDAAPLKDAREVREYAERLAEAGYTVFAINHRAAPRFHFPDPVEDAQRAVRVVRSRAADYGISPDRIGAWGSSSGGHLALLLGVLDGAGDPTAVDPILRVSAKVQAVAVLFAPTDLALLFKTSDRQGTIGAFMGFAFQDPTGGASSPHPDDVESRAYRQASPVTHVTADDPPTLLVHGDLDTTVPIAQSELMEAALRKAGVTVQFMRVPGGKHGPNFQFKAGDSALPDHKGEAVKWFDAHLKAAAPAATAR